MARHVAAVAGTALIALLAAAGAVAGVPPVDEVVAFHTPSGNIVCAAGPLIRTDGSLVRGRHGLLCVVFSASDSRGQKTWYMLPSGRAGVAFVQGNIRSEGLAFLGYGRSWARYGFRCESMRSGLTCRNPAGHGFFLSRETQRLF